MIPKISIQDYTYNLPDNQIARFPLPERDASRILVYRKGQISESIFSNVVEYLHSGTLLVFNNTKVIRARLLFTKSTGSRIEIFCLEPVFPTTFEQALSAKKNATWLCTVGNLKKWKNELLILECGEVRLTAEKVQMTSNGVTVRFTWNTEIEFGELIEKCGGIPIPPYLKREPEEIDTNRYQTVYSRHEGSVAAPTAGLHFTTEVLNRLATKNIETAELTLHVGAGTFKPVKAELIEWHDMHSEHFIINREVLKRILEKKEEIIAVGTTSVRMLESLYWLGLSIKKTGISHVNQWQPYGNEKNTPVEESIGNIISYMEKEGLTDMDASTQIMIVPTYRFRLIKGLITNFHQPQSTLLLLIAALIGNNWHKVYDYALANNFRFLSYGDSSLLMP